MVLLLGGAWLLTVFVGAGLTAPPVGATAAPEDICLVAPPQPYNAASGLALLAPLDTRSAQAHSQHGK